MRSLQMMLLGAAMLAATAPALAQNRMVTAENPASLVAALQAAGYKAELTKDSTGDPMINSAAGGSRFGILFYGCTNGAKCETIQFSASWNTDKTPDPKLINDWNRTKRWTKAFIDKEGDPVIDYDLDLRAGGIPEPVMISVIEQFTDMMGAFEKHIGW